MKNAFLQRISSPKVIPALGLLLGVAIGLSFSHFLSTRCRDSYSFINSSTVCDMPYVIDKAAYSSFQVTLEKYLQDQQSQGRVSEAAIYFQDLIAGPNFSINGMAEYAPASLLKLPLAIAYFNRAEEEPSVLSEQLSVAQPLWHFSEYYPPSQTIDPTEPHSTFDLLSRMLIYSDNNAYGVLQTNLYTSGLASTTTRVFLELGFLNPKNISDEVISVRQYSGIFRDLYNATYLNAKNSEQILAWLAHTEFNRGLRAGIPSDIVVADKFGERFTETGAKQLHDCGIIYYPGNPYLLCVMTRGDNFNQLSATIEHISAMVYQEVDSRRLP